MSNVIVNKIELATNLIEMLIIDMMTEFSDEQFNTLFPNGIFKPLNLDEPEEEQMGEYTEEGQKFFDFHFNKFLTVIESISREI